MVCVHAWVCVVYACMGVYVVYACMGVCVNACVCECMCVCGVHACVWCMHVCVCDVHACVCICIECSNQYPKPHATLFQVMIACN